MQDDHISSSLWAGSKRDKLDVRQYTANHEDWMLDDRRRELLTLWGFSAFANTRSVPQNDIRLITALVDRWRPETNTFHFPFGGMVYFGNSSGIIPDNSVLRKWKLDGDIKKMSDVLRENSYYG